jgi:hypothetical protein
LGCQDDVRPFFEKQNEEGTVLRLSLDDGKLIINSINFLVTSNCHNPAQIKTKLGWLYTVLISSALATATPDNLAMPHSNPIYWGRKATPIFLATPQSTLVFFGTKSHFGPSEVRAPAVGVAHAGGERSVHY